MKLFRIYLVSLLFLFFFLNFTEPASSENLLDQISGVTILDSGTNDAPSDWKIINGSLVQKSNIWGGSTTKEDPVKPGTYLIWGQSDWTDYTFTLDMKAKDDDAFGFLLRYQDDNTYYRFSLDKQRNLTRFIKKSGGFVSVLSEKEEGFTQNKWYHVKADVQGNRFKIYLDDRLILDISDSAISSGKTGLYCWGNENTEFKDIKVVPVSGTPVVMIDEVLKKASFITTGIIPPPPEKKEQHTAEVNTSEKPFIFSKNNSVSLDISDCAIHDEGRNDGPSSWYAFDGVLSQASNIWGGSVTATNPEKPGTYAIIGTKDWSNHALSVDFRSQGDGAIGVMFRYKNENNYYRFSMDNQNGYRRLIKKLNGSTSVMSENKGDYPAGQWNSLQIKAIQGNITVFINDKYALSATDNSFTTGKIGLYCWGNENTEFKAIKVTTDMSGIETLKPAIVKEPPPPQPVAAQKPKPPETKIDDKGPIPSAKDSGLLKPEVAPTPLPKVKEPPKKEYVIKPEEQIKKIAPVDQRVLDAGFEIVDEGLTDGPSTWKLKDGILIQSSNIWGGDNTASDPFKPGTLAIMGGQTWTDFSLNADLRSTDDDGIGIVFRYQDQHNYYRLSLHKQRSYRRLIKKVNGLISILAEDNVPYQTNRWYSVKINALSDTIKIMIDNKPVFSVVDSSLPNGKAGLYSWGNQNSEFKNIKVDHLVIPVPEPDDTPDIIDDALRGMAYPIDIRNPTIIDEGTSDKPSFWNVRDNILIQTSNIWGGSIASADLYKPGTMALFGKNSWDNYTISVKLSSRDDDEIGVVFRYQDLDNYYRVSMNRQLGYLRLIKKVNGRTALIDEIKNAYEQSRWYRYKIAVTGKTIKVQLDNKLIFDKTDESITSGKIGFYCWGNENSEFKDILVIPDVSPKPSDVKPSPEKAVPSDFAKTTLVDLEDFSIVDDGKKNGPSSWSVANGILTQSTNIWGGTISDADPSQPGTYAIYGDISLTNYQMSVELKSGDDDSIGVLFRYQDQDNYYRFSMNRQQSKRRLVKKVDGKVTILTEDSVSYDTDLWYKVNVRLQDNAISVFVDDRRVFDVRDSSLGAGKIGLYCWGNEKSSFRNIMLTPSSDEQPKMYEVSNPIEQAIPEPVISETTPKQQPLSPAPPFGIDTGIPLSPKVDLPMTFERKDSPRDQSVEEKAAPVLQTPPAAKQPAMGAYHFKIVDEGSINAPSTWAVYDKVLLQSSNIWGGSDDGKIPAKPGTYALLDIKNDMMAYEISADLRAQDDDSIGVIFGYQDDNNYYRFSMDRQRRFQRLVKKHDGVFSILAENKTGFDLAKWYAFKAKVIPGKIRIYLDDALVFTVSENSFSKGSIAMYAWGNEYAEFKNIRINPLETEQTAAAILPEQQKKVQTMPSDVSLESEKNAAEDRLIEEKRLEEEARKAEQFRRAEALKKAEEERIADAKRKEEQARIDEQIKKAEDAKRAEQLKKIEAARQAELIRLAEEKRKAEDARLAAEQAKKAAELKRAEAERLAEEKKQAEEKKRAEAQIKADAQKKAVLKQAEIIVPEDIPAEKIQETLTDVNKSKYVIVDEGTQNGPSSWSETENGMIQHSNIWGGSTAKNDPEKPGTYVIWGEDWSNYIVEAKIRSLDNDEIGIIFRYRDNNNYYRFSMNSQLKYRRFIKKVDGKVIVLASDDFAYNQGQWYSIKIKAIGKNIELYIDNSLIFTITDISHKFGKIGLYSWANDHSEFSDLSVLPMSSDAPPSKKSNYETVDEGTKDGPSDWTVENGVLIQKSNIWGGEKTKGAILKPGAYAIWGESWLNCTIEMDLRSRDDDSIGIMFRYKDKNNYYRFEMNREYNYRRLIKRVDGNASVLAEDTFAYDMNTWYKIKISVFEKDIRVYFEDKLLFNVMDDSVSYGKICFYSWDNQGSEYKEVSVLPLQEKSEAIPPAIRSDYQVIDEGENEGPSKWDEHKGKLVQSSNIWGGSKEKDAYEKPGTCLIWNQGGDNYTLEADLMSHDNDDIGILLRFRDKNNYYRFSMNSQQSYRRLIKKKNGQTSLLAEDNIPYIKDQWQSVKAILFGDRILVSINGETVFDVTDNAIHEGKIGFYCWNNDGAEFDNIELTPLVTSPFRADNLTIEFMKNNARKTDTLKCEPVFLFAGIANAFPSNTGENVTRKLLNTEINCAGYTLVDEGEHEGPSSWYISSDGVLIQASNIWGDDDPQNPIKPGTYALGGKTCCKNYRFSCDIRAQDDDAMGIMFRYLNNKNYYRFAMNRQQKYRKLVKIVDGKYTVLAEDFVPYVQNQWYQVNIKVVENTIEVYLDGAPIFNVYDDSLIQGKIGLYCWGNENSEFRNPYIIPLPEGPPEAEKPVSKKTQPVTEIKPVAALIEAVPEFSRVAHKSYTIVDEGTNKGPSSWAVIDGILKQTSNIWGGDLNNTDPDKPGTYVLWGDNWGNYTVTGDIKSQDDDAVGVMFRYKDNNNYYRFTMNRQLKCRQLVKKESGKYKILAQDDIPFDQNRWYTIQITAITDTIAVRVDGNEIFSVKDSSLKKGKVGLYCWGNENSEFDNFMITPYTRKEIAENSIAAESSVYHVDPENYSVVDEGENNGPSSWSVENAILTQKSNIWGGSIDGTDPDKPGTYALYGKYLWRNYGVSLDLRSEDDDGIGAMVRYQDKNNYYRIAINNQEKYRRVIKKVNGVVTILAQDNITYTPNIWFTLKIVCVEDKIKFYQDGKLIFNITDNSLRTGKVGLYCWGNTGSEFKNISVKPIQTRHGAQMTEPSGTDSFKNILYGYAEGAPLLFPEVSSETPKRILLTPLAMAEYNFSIVDEGKNNGPSNWIMTNGIVKQTSNIWGGNRSGIAPVKPGTMALWKEENHLSDYTMTVSLRSSDNDAIGVLFGYQDENNYYRLSMDRERQYRRLIKKYNGIVTILAEDRFAYEKMKWYDLKIEVAGSSIKAYMGNSKIFDIYDQGVNTGKVGLYCWGNADSEFKDITITPFTRIETSVADITDDKGKALQDPLFESFMKGSQHAKPENKTDRISFEKITPSWQEKPFIEPEHPPDLNYRAGTANKSQIPDVPSDNPDIASTVPELLPDLEYRAERSTIAPMPDVRVEGPVSASATTENDLTDRVLATTELTKTKSPPPLEKTPWEASERKLEDELFASFDGDTEDNHPKDQDNVKTEEDRHLLLGFNGVETHQANTGLLDGFGEGDIQKFPATSSSRSLSFTVLFELNGYFKLSEAFNFAHQPPESDQADGQRLTESDQTDWQGLSQLRAETQLEVNAKFLENWKGYFAGKGYYDFAYDINGLEKYTEEVLDTYESDAELNEAYIEGELNEQLDIKIGRQIVVWGKSENIQVTDILNPLDIREPGLTDIEYLRLPVFMCRLDYTKIPWTWTLITIHENRFNRIPAYGSDFYPYDIPPPEDDIPDKPEFASSVSGSFRGMDLSFYAANVLDDTGYITINPSGLTIKHPRVTMFGAAMNYALGNFLVKMEAAQFSGIRYTNADQKFSKTNVLAGLEYSGFTNTTLCLEAANEYISDFDRKLEDMPDEAEENLLLTAFRLTKTFINETLTLSIYAQAYGNDFEGGSFERFMAEYDLSDAIQLSGSLMLYQSGYYSLFKSIGDNDRVYFDIKYSF